MTALFNISGAWTDYWSAVLPVNGYLIVVPNSRPPGFDLGRHEWVLFNRFRTTQGRCANGAMWTRLSVTVELINKQCLTS
jgi:hypothetical protein